MKRLSCARKNAKIPTGHVFNFNKNRLQRLMLQNSDGSGVTVEHEPFHPATTILEEEIIFFSLMIETLRLNKAKKKYKNWY